MADDRDSGSKKDTKKRPDQPNQEPSELEKVGKSYRVAWVYAEYAFQYGVTIVLCMGIGYFLDKWLNTGVILTIIGVFFGAAAGFINLLKALNKKTPYR